MTSSNQPLDNIPKEFSEAFQSLRRDGINTRQILEMLDTFLFQLNGLPEDNPLQVTVVLLFSQFCTALKKFHELGPLGELVDNIKTLLGQMEMIRNEMAQQTYKMYANNTKGLLSDTDAALSTQQQLKTDMMAFEKHIIEQLIMIVSTVKQDKKPNVKAGSQEILNQLNTIRKNIGQYTTQVRNYSKTHEEIKRNLEFTYNSIKQAAPTVGVIPSAPTPTKGAS